MRKQIVQTLAELEQISPCGFHSEDLSQADFERLMEAERAIWMYPYLTGGKVDPTKPHVVLTKGGHSDLYINLGQQLKDYPMFAYGLGCTLFDRLLTDVDDSLWDNDQVIVVGAATSSTDLAEAVASVLAVEHVVLEKVKTDAGTLQVWPEDLPCEITPETIVLQVEELVSTSSSAQAVRDGALKRFGFEPKWYLKVLAVVDRSPVGSDLKVGESKIVSLFRYESNIWQPEACPLCAAGSPAIGDVKNNWAELTGNG